MENKFPDDFLFGVGTSAVQIEGHHGRGETVMEHFIHKNPSMVADQSNPSIACDSYRLYQEDIKLVKELGVQFYRFSISWPRILPTGYPNQINLEAIQYYNNLIDGLIANNIIPVVTMWHCDLPKTMLDLGGWLNPQVANFFEEYARVLFKHFGDRVPYWITLNINFYSTGDDWWPPMTNQSGIAEYLLARTIVLAHAKVYRLYQNEFKGLNGQVGFTTDGHWYEAASDQDEKVAELARQFYYGLFMHPVYCDGDFPKVVKERVEELSLKEGFGRSRLPEFSKEERDLIKGSFDYVGINVYTSQLVKAVEDDNDGTYSMRKDIGCEIFQDDKWEGGAASPWLKIVPDGLRKTLKWLKQSFNNPPIIITENGFSDFGELEDLGRINYFKRHLRVVLEAIYEDGVNVKAYSAWSLMDNFEWLAGYTEKFGLYHVDFNDPKRRRTAKSSAKWYKKLIQSRSLETTERR